MLSRLGLPRPGPCVARNLTYALQCNHTFSRALLKGQLKMFSAAAGNGSSVVDDKKELRRQVKQELRKLSEDAQQAESVAIAERVMAADYFRHARSIGVYLHCLRLREVDTSVLVSAALHKEGSKCYVPRVLDRASNMELLHLDDLTGLMPVTPFNILEPTATCSDGRPRENVLEADAPLELLLMPGLAFDERGRRCGRGGGYYDKLLSKLGERAAHRGWDPPILVALAFRSQLVDSVPMAPNDRGVDIIVTADRDILCSERARQRAGQGSS